MDMLNDLEMAQIRREFAITRKTIYMNSSAVAPTPVSTIKAVTDFLVGISERGPDSEETQQQLDSLLTEVRTRVSHLINCDRDEVVLTQSTTHGINIISRGISWKKGDAIVVRGGRHEHYANYLPWLSVAQSMGLELRELAIDRNGFFDPGALEKTARGARLLTMSHVLYNTGAIMPVEEVGKIAAEAGAFFCVDAAQSAGALEVDVKKIGCHFMAFPGFKWLCGPLGIGVLYCSKKVAELVEPSATGTESALLSDNNVLASLEMPARLQAGFRNYPGAAGLEAALRYTLRIGVANIAERNSKLASVLREELSRVQGMSLYGSEDESRRSSIVSFDPPVGTDASTIVKRLGENGVIFAAREIGEGRKVVRAAPHFFNDEEEVQRAAGYLRSM